MSRVEVQTGARILFEIVVCGSNNDGGIGPSIPSFISEMMEGGQSSLSSAVDSFSGIVKTRKATSFNMLEGIGTQELPDSLNWIELSEALIE
jgi:hypothetical protein